MVTMKDAKDVSEAIIKAFHPVLIIIFGSVAKEGVGADLDVLVVTEDNSETINSLNLSIHRCFKHFYKKFAIDPFIFPISIFNDHYLKGSPFLRLILKEGRLLYMKDAVKQWIKQAEDELNMAEYLFQGKYFKGACFHSQQSIEKSIKAVLINKGWELEKTHSLERLISIGEEYHIQVDLPDEDVVFIDSIYRGRYPAEVGLLPLGEPSEADAQKAVNMAKHVFENLGKPLKVPDRP